MNHKAVGATPFWLSEHFERLKGGAAEIGLTIPFSESRICDGVDRLLAGATEDAPSVGFASALAVHSIFEIAHSATNHLEGSYEAEDNLA